MEYIELEKKDKTEIFAIIEGLLFAAGQELSIDKISDVVDIEKKNLRSILNDMAEYYKNSKRGIMLREINGSFQLCTRFEHHDYIKKLFEPKNKPGLSQAAFETLAIIAYNQPITRAKVESIRGVNCDSSITKLFDKKLIKETGRLDAPGKPILYSTTTEFLRSFGLNSLTELKGIKLENEETNILPIEN